MREEKTCKMQVLDNFDVLYLVIQIELQLFIEGTISLPQALQTP